MEFFFAQLINGLTVGSVYALIALGYTMVYGVLKLINFAHGELFTIGAFLGLTLLTSFALTDTMGILSGVILLAIMVFTLIAIIGVLLERTAYRPLRQSPRLSAVVSALGASIFFQNAIMLIYGARDRVYPHDIIPNIPLDFLGIKITLFRIIILASATLLMLGLYLFIQKTKIGTAIRAVAINQVASKLMGVNVNQVIMLVFFIGPALGGVAGLMVGLYYGRISFTLGWTYGLKAFTAAIMGGIGNIPGAMIGGLILGVIEALCAAYISIAWKDGFTFLVLIMILIFRPTGILGERVAEKI